MDRKRSPKLVVAAFITDETGRLLITKRPLAKPFGGFWELPGGKIEAGESPKEALLRELKEEIDVSAEVRDIYEVIFYSYEEFDVLILVYSCTLTKPPRAIEVDDMAWVSKDQIRAYKLLPADLPIVDKFCNNKL